MWWKNTDPNYPHDCTVEQLEEAIQGYFTADANPNSLSQTPGISSKVSVYVLLPVELLFLLFVLK